MTMKVNKRALRLLPVTFLIELLAPFITLLLIGISAVISGLAGKQTGVVTAISSSLVLLSIWLVGMVFVYGIMSLSRYFRYSWYFHIVFFIIKSVALVLESIPLFIGDEMSAGTKNGYSIVSDVLSSARQLSGFLALFFAMSGFCAVLSKLGEQKLTGKCRKYSYFFLIIGILFTLDDIASLVVNSLFSGSDPSVNAENLPMLVIYVILNLLTLIISIPAFLTIRRSCKTIYGTLHRAQEV